jgi:hypothetical protein
MCDTEVSALESTAAIVIALLACVVAGVLVGWFVLPDWEEKPPQCFEHCAK